MISSHLDGVFMTIGMAVLYLLVVRLLDVNEREPLWAVLLTFVCGGAGAAAIHLVANPLVLTLDPLRGAALRELALFAALVVAFRVLAEIGRLRGWSEVTDLLDGVIYGVAGGLGFACGEAIATLEPALPLPLMTGGLWATFGISALAGFAPGVFGGVIGAGFGVATNGRPRVPGLWPIAGLAVAILVHVGHDELAYGNALGPTGLMRRYAALGLAVLVVLALAAYGLITERRLIARELADEGDGTIVTPAELALLRSVGRRQISYLHGLATVRLGETRARAGLHNRQVMLALAKRRAARATDDRTRLAAATEIDALRRSILDMRARLEAAAAPSGVRR